MKTRIFVFILLICVLSSYAVSAETATDILRSYASDAPGTSTSDWSAIGLMVSDSYINKEEYLAKLGEYVTSKYNSEEKLSRNKATEWHRIIIAVNLAGGNAENFFGINLVKDGIYYRENLDRQGLNSFIWALIAINSGDFKKQENSINSELGILNEIISRQNPDGGFSLSKNGSSGCDITAMALYALSFYKENPIVNGSIVRAVNYLVKNQNSDGTFSEGGISNLESTAQVMIAVKAYGDKFYNKFYDLYNTIMKFKTENGFSHVLDGDTDVMATYQAICALSAYNKNRPIYSANSIKEEAVEIPTETLYTKPLEYNTEIYTQPQKIEENNESASVSEIVYETDAPSENKVQELFTEEIVEINEIVSETVLDADSDLQPEKQDNKNYVLMISIVAIVGISVIMFWRVYE